MAIPIGTSGWSYGHWAGILYPRKASSLVRLDTYAQQFESVEVNNTFYRWPKDQVFTTWHDRLPQGFLVSVKSSRGLTQFRKLHDLDSRLERMESRLTHLGKKRGVFLVKLPPHFGRNLERLDLFLASVPSHQRSAVEFRHPSWTETDETFALLERRRAAYCVTNGADLPCIPRATAHFVYIRFYRPDDQARYTGCYSEAELYSWAERIGEWRAQQCDVFAYFNNDGYGHAVRNALRLKELAET